eukprot:749272-Prorocentrum_minimum.AAC.1
MSEIAGCVSYTTLMVKRGMATLKGLVRIPTWSSLGPLLVGGLAIQLRSLALNIGLLSVSRATLVRSRPLLTPPCSDFPPFLTPPCSDFLPLSPPLALISTPSSDFPPSQMMDPSGTAAAAHAITINLWQIAGVVLLALSSAATILIPKFMSKAVSVTPLCNCLLYTSPSPRDAHES